MLKNLYTFILNSFKTATLEMRTTFFQMRLFNDDLIMSGTSFILNGKEWGEGKIEREKEKE